MNQLKLTENERSWLRQYSTANEAYFLVKLTIMNEHKQAFLVLDGEKIKLSKRKWLKLWNKHIFYATEKDSITWTDNGKWYRCKPFPHVLEEL